MTRAITLELAGQGWSSGPVRLAATFLDRLAGVLLAPAVLIPGRSVHGFGLHRPLWAVGLDKGLRVVAVRALKPGRVVLLPGARLLLELPIERTPPSVGSVLSIVGGWPER